MLKKQSSYIGDCMAQVNAETNSDIQKENVIRADSLRRGDTVLLHTHNSVYQFLVSDQKISSGSLAGGVLGDQSVVASLVGTIFNNCVDFDSWELGPGARAVFFIERNRSTQRLVTSPITETVLVRNNLRESRAA